MQVNRQMQRGHKCQKGDNEREKFDIAIAPRDQQNQQPTRCRDERDQRKNDGIEAFHVNA